MTATPAEFVGSLRTAFPAELEVGEGWAVVCGAEARLRFDFAVVAPLRVGSLALPRLQVAVSVLVGDAEAAQKLLAAVDRATQRGGG